MQVIPESTATDKSFLVANDQNVHADEVLIAGAEMLSRIKAKIPPEGQLTTEKSDLEIQGYLKFSPSPELALTCMDRVMERIPSPYVSQDAQGDENEFGDTLPNTMAILWSYMENIRDPVLKEKLRDSMVMRL